ncbi:MAG: phosphate ABC transporter permease PstA [Dehalococcoidales bacterium]|jgi:phosphate transport system permease protein|nr:phosphate ABC transporter permease PstA [Dehalococcoidales bacterium]NLT27454.1 phosphate ABC transporter permease PstA [Dehalococcoidales bacterium]
MRNVSAKQTQKLAMAGIWGGGVITLLLLIVIIGYVLIQGLPGINWEFLSTNPKGGLSGEGGILSTVVSTLYLIGITLVLLVPIGIGSAVYLSEYAPNNRLTRIIRYGIETLAGIPSIIFGLFGYALFVTVLSFNFSILSGALTLVCLLLPTMITTTEEALKAVSYSYREAALALGTTKWQMISRIVLPSAIPGIVTAVILCIGRAIGETACLYVTMGGSAAMPSSLLEGGRTLSLHVFYLAMETNAMDKAMATAAVLIIIIILINALTNLLAGRFQKRLKGIS